MSGASDGHIWPHDKLERVAGRCAKTHETIKKSIKDMEWALSKLKEQFAKIDHELFYTVEVSIMQRDNAEQSAEVHKADLAEALAALSELLFDEKFDDDDPVLIATRERARLLLSKHSKT